MSNNTHWNTGSRYWGTERSSGDGSQASAGSHLAEPGNLAVSAPGYAQSDLPCRASTVAAYRDAVAQAIALMYARFAEPLPLQDMAAAAALSPYHFNRIFRLITGITPCHFLCAIRLKAAMHLLLTTQLSVIDVCFAVGYNSLGTFTTRFTQLIGLPPTQLRDLVDKAPSMLELFSIHSANLTNALPIDSGVKGRVRTSAPTIGCIFIGLFPTAVPQGRPMGCTLLSTPGVYHISPVSDGRYYVLAAGFPRSDNSLSYLLPDYTSLQVGASPGPLNVCGGHVDGRLDITLRPVTVTDPPLLSAIPLLLARWC